MESLGPEKSALDQVSSSQISEQDFSDKCLLLLLFEKCVFGKNARVKGVCHTQLWMQLELDLRQPPLRMLEV